ncbi:MAG: DNA-binding transcriptional regulator Fis [Pseudomonadales bacterium]|jgi:Fis family transcriptional regulator
MSNILNNTGNSQYSSVEKNDGTNNNTNTVGQTNNQTIRESVATSLTEYFNKVDHENINELYELVLSEMEAPLLEKVMHYTRSNQSKASAMLGLNRGTLRKKLKKYGMLN